MRFNDAVNEVREAITAQRYSRLINSIRIASLNRVVSFCANEDKNICIEDVLKKYYAHIKLRLMDDKITANQFHNEAKIINFIQVYYCLENIIGSKEYEPRASRYRQPSEYYRRLLVEYEECSANMYTASTLNTARASIRDFIFYLEDNCISNVSEITRIDISNYIFALSEKYNSNMSAAIGRVKIFCRHLTKKALLDDSLLHCFEVRPVKKIKLRAGFSLEEIDQIIAAVDKKLPAGKRNYAMLLLGKHTGLRGIDEQVKTKTKKYSINLSHKISLHNKTQRPSLPTDAVPMFA